MTHESKKNGGSSSHDYQHDVFVVDWAIIDKKENNH